MGMGTELRMLGWKFDTKLQNRGPVYRFFGAQFVTFPGYASTDRDACFSWLKQGCHLQWQFAPWPSFAQRGHEPMRGLVLAIG